MAGTRGVSVPLRFAIAAAEADGRPDDFDLPEPHEMLHLGRVGKPEDCVAAEIFDDSADVDFAPGTVLFLRPLTGLHEPQASHLLLLEAVAGRALVDEAYAAVTAGDPRYLWHEFGDAMLLLP